jgi:hypothetical protein
MFFSIGFYAQFIRCLNLANEILQQVGQWERLYIQ